MLDGDGAVLIVNDVLMVFIKTKAFCNSAERFFLVKKPKIFSGFKGSNVL